MLGDSFSDANTTEKHLGKIISISHSIVFQVLKLASTRIQ